MLDIPGIIVWPQVHPHSMSISLEGTNRHLGKVMGSPKCKIFVCGTCVSKKKILQVMVSFLTNYPFLSFSRTVEKYHLFHRQYKVFYEDLQTNTFYLLLLLSKVFKNICIDYSDTCWWGHSGFQFFPFHNYGINHFYTYIQKQLSGDF